MTADKEFTDFYRNKKNRVNQLYPTEFVVRTFLGRYPKLIGFNRNYANKKILDLGFGDGRNIEFLTGLGLDVYGVEVTADIVATADEYLKQRSIEAHLVTGHNSLIPFAKESFDYILACHSCYYMTAEDTFSDHLREIVRVLKPGGWLVASVPMADNFILDKADLLEKEYAIIRDDPFKLRNGSRLKYFSSEEMLISFFGDFFSNLSVATLKDDYFGILISAGIVVCQKPFTE